MKASEKLSQIGQNPIIGSKGGRGPRDLNNPDSNKFPGHVDQDADECGGDTSHELSESSFSHE